MTATAFGRIELPRRMLKLRRDPARGYPVPVVAEWSSETHLQLPPPNDPMFGPVAVTKGAAGDGVPLLGNMSPQRQRRAMLEHRCQVCDRDLRSSRFRFMAGGPQLKWFTEPWVCGPCMAFAVQVCPGLIRASRHDTPLVLHHVHDVEFCQERIGFKPPLLQGKGEFYSAVHNMAADSAMRERDSWLADFGYRPQPEDRPGLRYTSLLYFVRVHVVDSTRYDVAGFLDAFDWTGQ